MDVREAIMKEPIVRFLKNESGPPTIEQTLIGFGVFVALYTIDGQLALVL